MLALVDPRVYRYKQMRVLERALHVCIQVARSRGVRNANNFFLLLTHFGARARADGSQLGGRPAGRPAGCWLCDGELKRLQADDDDDDDNDDRKNDRRRTN